MGEQRLPGTWRNRERSGKRQLTRLSTIARNVKDVRHLDFDLIQYCPGCHRPQAFCEVKKYPIPDKGWEQIRLHAAHWGQSCVAILVVEAAERIGVKQYFSSTGMITPHVIYGNEDDLQRVLEHARDIHECHVRS